MRATHTLALCLDGPMQSWGVSSRGVIRDTGREPSKSGIVGLLGAALGVARDDHSGIRELAEFRMGVRVDREGILERDYQTATGVPKAGGSGHETVVSERYYLADAVFLVVVESPDSALLKRLEEAVPNPRFPICLGRHAYLPARPLLADRNAGATAITGWGVRECPLETVLATHPWLENQPGARRYAARAATPRPLRTVQDCPPTDRGAELRHDVPVSFARGARRFVSRTVRTGHVPLTPELMVNSEEMPCT